MASATYIQILRQANLAPTHNRLAVLSAVHRAGHPQTAQMLHWQLRRDTSTRTGLATVYRILRTLTGAGLVHEISLHGQRAYRACRTHPHHHLVCDRCGTVTEYPAAMATPWLENISGATGFQPSPTAGDIHGTCPACPPGTPELE